MTKQAERDYLRQIGPAAVRHVIDKPFSDALCGRYLVELGTIISLLPPPPARVLDLGCGGGWSSIFLARAGYEVVGLDISPEMIGHAEQKRRREGLPNLAFQVGDYEELTFTAEFDAAVFYGSLHHAVDEEQALRRSYLALTSGGRCITCEPGQGHQNSPWTVEIVRRYQVTEKDMPPGKIIELGKMAGFCRCRMVPHPLDLALASSATAGQCSRFKMLLERLPGGSGVLRWRRLLRFLGEIPQRSGLVVMEKG